VDQQTGFLDTRQHTLEERCAVAHAPGRQPRPLQRSRPTRAQQRTSYGRSSWTCPSRTIQSRTTETGGVGSNHAPSSTEASATLVRNYNRVITISAIISPETTVATGCHINNTTVTAVLVRRPSWTYGSAFRAHEPGWPRFPPTFASISRHR
jgi:hypothetical protein